MNKETIREWSWIPAVIGLFSLIFLVIRHINHQAELKKSHVLLIKTIQEIQSKLPPADTPETELIQKMPVYFKDLTLRIYPTNRGSNHQLLRNGFRYYPERQAFKYTFDDRCIRRGDSQCDEKTGIPYSLERRSIWFRVDNGKWTCYAGMKSDIRQYLCTDSSIIQNLKKSEHDTAWRIDDCSGLFIWLKNLNLPQDSYANYVSIYDTKNVYIAINQDKPSILILDTTYTDEFPNNQKGSFYVFHTQNSKISAVILTGNNNKYRIYGLPKNIPIFDKNRACDSELGLNSSFFNHFFHHSQDDASLFKGSIQIAKFENGAISQSTWQIHQTIVEPYSSITPTIFDVSYIPNLNMNILQTESK